MQKPKLLSISFLVAGILLNPLFLLAATVDELYEQGTKNYQDGNYKKAIQYLEEAVKVNPNHAPSYNALGLAYRETNPNLKEVAWYFKAAVDIDPTFVEAYDNLGKAYYGMGQFDKAELYCKKALEINPEYGSSQFSLAWIYLLGKSRPADAIYYFNKVLEKAKIPNAYFGLGMAYFMTDNRPMVLEMITTLRQLEDQKLAEQLENMVRDYHYLPGQDGGTLLKIKPPEGGTELQPPAKNLSPDLKSETPQVEIHGKLIDLSDSAKEEADKAAQKNLSSSIVPAAGASTATASKAPEAEQPTIQIQRTIQILPRDQDSGKDSGY